MAKKSTTGPPNLEDIVPLFIVDFCDIPLRGICRHGGETLFFALASDLESDEPLDYAVFRLPQKQTEFFVQQKAEFVFRSYSRPLTKRPQPRYSDLRA